MARVLIVDDSPTVCTATAWLVEGLGHEVETARSMMNTGSIALRFEPDVVLLDLEMPPPGGVAIGHFLRERFADRVAIVIHSERPIAELSEAASQLNAVGLLRKGAGKEEVERLIQRALSFGR